MNFISGKSSSNLVAASFEILKEIAQHAKPFSDGDYIKEAWLKCTPSLFDNFSKKIIQRIKDLSLSRKAVTDRILKLESDTTKQLRQDLYSCKYFFLLMKGLILHHLLGWQYLLDFVKVTKYVKSWLPI